jgi:2-polyprenyl-6-methoxyphenol hydroxylase-like FAD-dependent oxidoreductase
MRVLIVGAGIAGLTLAGLLRQRGIAADIVERAPDFSQGGYVLGLYPLGSRILHGLGVHRSFVARSEAAETYTVASGNGRVLKQFDLCCLTGKLGEMRMLARADLLRLLARAAGDPDGIRTGVTVTALVPRAERVHVTTSDGKEADYDLVIGADGMHSQIREFVSSQTEAYDSKWACEALWVKRAAVPNSTVFEQWGSGRFVGFYPTPGKTGVIVAAPQRILRGEKAEDRGARARRAFRRMRGPAQEALASFNGDAADIFYWKLEDRRAKDWAKGRMVLLGDAACAFLPTAGIGASMAMESAAVLADELSRAGAAEIPLALANYEKRRRRRVEAAQDDSRKLARRMFASRGPMSWLRNRAVGFMSLDSLAKNIVKMLDEPI